MPEPFPLRHDVEVPKPCAFGEACGVETVSHFWLFGTVTVTVFAVALPASSVHLTVIV